MDDIKNCRKCGTECSVDYKFCPNCGASLDDCKCFNCGAVLIEGAKFCVNCGARVEEEIQEEPQTETETEVAEEEQPVADEAEEAVSSVESEAHTHIVYEAPKAVKTVGAKTGKKNYVLRLIKNASVFVLCTILFALSFCNIVTVKADDYIDRYLDYDIENCEASLSAVDVIGVMFSTASDDGVEEKYSEDLLDIFERFEKSVQKDYNPKTERIVLSSKSQGILSEAFVCYLKMYLSSEEAKGSSLYNNIIIAGTFCLLNILFSAAMLIVSIISLTLVALKKKNRVSKFLYAMPAYLFISLLILFIVKTTLGFGTAVASAMGATLFFEIAAIITTVILIFSATKKKSLKNAIPKLVSIATSLIICACTFAPVFTAKYDLVLKNKSKINTYTVSVGAEGLLTYPSPDEIESLGDELTGEQYQMFIGYIDSLIENLSDSTPYEFNRTDGKEATDMIMGLLIIAAENYVAVGVLSIGYYILLLIFVAFGAFAILSVANLFKKESSMHLLFILALIILITALGCSIGWICIMNYHLEDLALSFTVGGGLIAGIAMTILTLIFAPVFKAIAYKEKHIESEEFAIDAHDAVSAE